MGREKKIKARFIGRFCMYKEVWLIGVLTLLLHIKLLFWQRNKAELVVVLDTKSSLIIKQTNVSDFCVRLLFCCFVCYTK